MEHEDMDWEEIYFIDKITYNPHPDGIFFADFIFTQTSNNKV